jgi:hypothetical protein
MAADDYQDYVRRFEAEVGTLVVGAYAKWRGRLIRRLSPDEFARKRGEFQTLDSQYRLSLERGDTLNDVVTRLLSERRAELLIPEDVTG